MKRPRIKCRSCRGKGFKELNGPHLRTFNKLKVLGRATARQVHSRLKENVDVTAVNNRLRRMVNIRLIKIVRKVNPILYAIV